MAKVTSDVHHVVHIIILYVNPIVVSVSSATGRAYTMLRQTECQSGATVCAFKPGFGSPQPDFP